MAKEQMPVFVKPVLILSQLAPLSVERKTPPSQIPGSKQTTAVPAKRSLLELIAKDQTEIFVKLVWLQLVPLSLERLTPPSVPAKRSPRELMGKDHTGIFVKLVWLQLVPLSLERK